MDHADKSLCICSFETRDAATCFKIRSTAFIHLQLSGFATAGITAEKNDRFLKGIDIILK